MSVSSGLAGHPFAKMNGIGNQIIVLDLRGLAAQVTPEQARAIHTGAFEGQSLSFDQMMVLHDPRTPGTDAFMSIWNNDGTLSGACGNGTRCVAWLMLHASERTSLKLETSSGILACERAGALDITVDMGRPRLAWDEIPLAEEFADTRTIELQIGPIDAPILHTPSVVNMGNPHAIFWVKDTKAYDLARIGSLLEYHPIFPERANISLCQVVSPSHLVLRVWERGVGLTQACGSAACAALVAAARLEKTGRKARVSLPGGDLTIEWRENDGHVMMTGLTELEFEGRLPASIFSQPTRSGQE